MRVKQAKQIKGNELAVDGLDFAIGKVVRGCSCCWADLARAFDEMFEEFDIVNVAFGWDLAQAVYGGFRR